MNRRWRLLGVAALLWSTTLPALAAESPIAVDDHVDYDGKTIHIYVLANDSPSGEPLDPTSLSIVSMPSLGQAEAIATVGSARVKYTAGAAQAGSDSFIYRICDTAGGCATATVTVNVVLATTTTTTTSPPTTTTTTTSPILASPDTTSTILASPDTTSTSEAAVSPSPTTSLPLGGTPPPTPTQTEDDPTFTPAAVAPAPTGVVVEPEGGTSPRVHLLGEIALSTHDILTAPGTTVGEPLGINLEEVILYLDRSSRDTLEVVALPAVMVSGVVGFLLVGLPQNAAVALLGLLAGFRRKKKDTARQGSQAAIG
jgi:hypothetical protein